MSHGRLAGAIALATFTAGALGASAVSCPATTLRITPPRAGPGQAVELYGSGFYAGACPGPAKSEQGIRVTMSQGTRTWRLATVDSSTEPGDTFLAFQITVTVPLGARPGVATIEAVGPTRSARARLTIQGLPGTGLPSTAVPIALALGGIGFALRLAARRST